MFLLELVRSRKACFRGLRINSCLVGQRYHVVVEAKPVNISYGDAPDSYWIRTIPANGCNTFPKDRMPANTTGILRYNAKDHATPTTVNGSYSLKCADEPYDKLKPILPWTVGKPSNERMTQGFFFSCPPTCTQKLITINRANEHVPSRLDPV